ncbi:S53 family peptidase [Sorangium sp. So ce448]|uniref:S53 family peptidase n=1 Tax=Sorangium sp. So ce448 TaxID=3133314 RepID=UPI003F648CBB
MRPAFLDKHACRHDKNASKRHEPAAQVTVILVLCPPQGEPLPSQEELCQGGLRTPLTYEQYREKYGVPSETLDRVQTWAEHRGLTFPAPDWRAKAELSGVVRLMGSLPKLRHAFKVHDLDYVEIGGSKCLKHSGAFDLGELRDVVLWVYGLNTSHTVLPAAPYCRRLAPDDAAGPGRVHRYLPREVAGIYNYPPNEGERQTLGIVELSGSCSTSDLSRYFEAQGIEPRIVQINLGPLVSSFALANLEVTLDVELAASVCPEATTVVYNACSEDFSLRDFFDVFNEAVFDTVNRPSVLSTSWGFPEFVAGLEGDIPPTVVRKEEQEPFNLLFRKAALLGITICASSGDTGSLVPFVSDCTPTGSTMLPTTSFPSSSPLVLGCGGTSLEANAREVVWNRLAEVLVVPLGNFNMMMPGGASGGGVSQLNDCPSYQASFNVPKVTVVEWVDGVAGVVQSRPGRGVPDVAANADISTGYEIFYDGHPGVGGGTSASAPMWAALITRINSALGRRVGFVNASLYRQQKELRNLCKTITEGGNGAYHASSALWNPCTGLGSPNGVEILGALKVVLPT